MLGKSKTYPPLGLGSRNILAFNNRSEPIQQWPFFSKEEAEKPGLGLTVKYCGSKSVRFCSSFSGMQSSARSYNATYHLINRAKNLVNLTKGRFVLKEHGGIEFRDFIDVQYFEDHVVLRSVHI